jgi:hypothetical protein
VCEISVSDRRADELFGRGEHTHKRGRFTIVGLGVWNVQWCLSNTHNHMSPNDDY